MIENVISLTSYSAKFLLIERFIMKQYAVLQVHFGKIWQIGFGKITVSKRIKRTKITLICGLFNLK